MVDKPDIKGRKDIFLVHMRRMVLDKAAAVRARELNTFDVGDFDEELEEELKAAEEEEEGSSAS